MDKTDTVWSMARRMAFEGLVEYCVAQLDKLNYDASDLAAGFGVVADLQIKQLAAYEEELKALPEVQKPKEKVKE